MFFTRLTILSNFTNANPLSANKLNAIPLGCISMNNQPCKARPEIINVSSNNPVFYPFSIKANVVVIVIILMILMQKYVLLML